MAALIGVSVKPTAGGDYVCKVPLDLLSEDGVPPQEGDKVSYSVDGTVQSVTGADAEIKIESINGEPVTEEAGEGASDNESAEGAGGSSASMRPGLAAAAKGGGLGTGMF